MKHFAFTKSAKAFTLIELLVVIAIIALLIGILLPSLSGARDIARSVVCKSRNRTLATAQNQYMLDNQDYYAGRNTTGVVYRLDYLLWSVDPEFNEPSSPTTWMDWISPVLGDSMNMPIPRPERTMFIFNTLADPASQFFNDKEFSSAADRDRFRDLIIGQGVRQISYTSPASFHYYPTQETADRASRRARIRHKKLFSPQWRPDVKWYDGGWNPEFVSPDTFQPRMDIVALQPSNKILVNCATRFYDPRPRILDFDINPIPGFYGSFHSSSPSYHESTEFGREFWRRRGATSPDFTNIQLSFRHPGQSINAGMFDGSVRSIRSEEAWSDPVPWFPSRSVYTSSRSTPTPEIAEKFDDGDVLP